MLKTKGFSSNNSLKRKAIIVDAPDLPPEECEFYITKAGIADSDKIEVPDSIKPNADFKIEELYEENENSSNSIEIPLTNVKGIGKGTADNLKAIGISNVEQLIKINPEEVAENITGASSKKIIEWQKSAKILLKT